jgi:hypothetical protein
MSCQFFYQKNCPENMKIWIIKAVKISDISSF